MPHRWTPHWRRIETSKISATWSVCPASANSESKDGSRSTVLEDSGQRQTPQRQIRCQWEQQSRNRMQIAGDGGELVGTARVLVCAVTGIDSYAASSGGVIRLHKKVCAYFLPLSEKAQDRAASEKHGRSWTNAQLLHKVEGVASTHGERVEESDSVAGSDGAQPQGEEPNTDTKGLLGTHCESFCSGFFSEDLHLFQRSSGTGGLLLSLGRKTILSGRSFRRRRRERRLPAHGLQAHAISSILQSKFMALSD